MIIMTEYRNLPFCAGAPCADFYSYFSLEDLINKATEDKELMLKCRTIGILQSIHGRFYLTDLDCPVQLKHSVQMSAVYLKTPPQSTVKPYPVQVFGTLQWKNRPVVFAKTLHVLTIPNAIRIRDAMKSIADRHQIDPTLAYTAQT
ncbi:uncharacterized protein LOC128670404 isoform X2 [Plodia interpunctella]|uniref:uncharacterized protein LOC128670404 isoform X2 n=1 Tax=Plodia interpunctella TaxID=58824 RepID=UPI00236760DA|nr:uncharacterized protein LOC128670404 isoform X2 [Plodia interpunctella]